jgi:NADP-dependent 3-hydroxy acid dehydrogenase YdfG
MQAVRQEAHAHGVKVSTIYPGLTDTYFAGQEPSALPNLNRLQSEDIAESVLYVAQAPDHVVIDEIFLHPFAQKHWQNP